MRKTYRFNFKSLGMALLLTGMSVLGSASASAAETAVPLSVTPADGSTVTDLSTISFDWGSRANPSQAAMDKIIYGTLSYNGEVISELYFDQQIKVTLFPAPSFTVQLGTLASEPGNYTVTIPAGFASFTVDGESLPNAEVVLNYTVEGAPEVTLETIQEDVPFTLVGSRSLNYQGVFTPTMTGVLTISYDPAVPIFSNRPVLFESDKTTEVDFSLEEDGSKYYYDVVEGVEYYYLMGEFNPEGYTLYLNGTYTVTFSVEGATAPEGAVPLSVTPADGSTVTDLSTISFDWGSAANPSNEALNKILYGTLSYNGEVISNLYFDQQIKATIRPAITFTVQLGDLASEPGNYTVTIPAGFASFTVDGESLPNAEVVLNYTVEAAPEVTLETIQDDVPFDLNVVSAGMGVSCNFQGVYTAPETGLLTVSFEPGLKPNNSNRQFLYESDMETPVEIYSFELNDEETQLLSYSFNVTEGETYYLLIGSYNPEGINLNASAGTYTVTFSVAEGGSSNPGDGGDNGDGDEGDGDDDNTGINAYEFSAFTGFYNEITDGTVVMDWDIYYALQDEGMQPEDNSFKAVLMGANGQLSCTTLPDAPTSLPGIPLGFEFEYAGNTFTHILISTSGYVMLGGENIGGILTGGQIMDGNMGKFVFQRGVPNVLGCVDTNSPECFEDTEISYLATANKMTVQYKNWGYAKTMASRGVPVDMQIILNSNGMINIVYNGWNTLEPDANDVYTEGGPVYIALKGAGETMITLEGDDLVDAELIRNVDMPSTTYIYASLPDGYTLSFTAPDFEMTYSVPVITSVMVDANMATVNYESEYAVNEMSLVTLDGTPVIEMSVTENPVVFEDLDPDTYLVSIRGVVSDVDEIYTEWSEPYQFMTQSSIINGLIENNGDTTFYNLQGVKVNNPGKGVYLMKKGDKVSKVIIR